MYMQNLKQYIIIGFSLFMLMIVVNQAIAAKDTVPSEIANREIRYGVIQDIVLAKDYILIDDRAYLFDEKMIVKSAKGETINKYSLRNGQKIQFEVEFIETGPNIYKKVIHQIYLE